MRMQYTTATTNVVKPNPRIMAQLSVQATWTDELTGNTISVEGYTENIGQMNALVNLDKLPPVGSKIQLRVMDEGEVLMEVPAEVIRVERDPSKPLAALSILSGVEEWSKRVWTAAQDWVARKWATDYAEEWVN